MKLKLNLFTKMKKPVCKLPLSLKITLFVLFSFASLLYASNNYAQRTMLNISSQTRTVSEVLTEIEKQTDFTFFYNNKQVDLKRKVTLNVKNENVFSVLKKLFSGTNTTYKVLDKNIILSEKSAISSATKEVAIVQQVGRSVKGVVVDDKGEPVIGATVMVKGSTNGTITDFDGNFILNDVSSNASLIITSVLDIFRPNEKPTTFFFSMISPLSLQFIVLKFLTSAKNSASAVHTLWKFIIYYKCFSLFFLSRSYLFFSK